MIPLLAQATTSSSPAFYSLIAGAVGLSGCVAAVLARRSVKKERDALRKADFLLTGEAAWGGAHASSHHDLSQWFRNYRIDVESGVADVIRTCWSAWLGLRSPSLAEIHAIVGRRERAKIPVRFSAGVAALLLVIGIVGTLASVKPVLADFQFRTSVPEGVVPATDAPLLVNVADSTALVNSLMNNLGDAFLPSLVALAFTVLVVAVRGLYTLEVQRYSLELDGFAVGTAMPHYRPRSLAEEYREIRSIFDGIAKSIDKQESGVAKTVGQLNELLKEMKPAVTEMKSGITNMGKAADVLANKSLTAAQNITEVLGETSPAYTALERFEAVSSSTNTRLERLAQLLNELMTEQETARNKVVETAENIVKTTGQIRSDFDGKMDRMEKAFGETATHMQSTTTEVHSRIQKEFTTTTARIVQGHQSTRDQINKEFSATTGQIKESSRLMNAEVLYATKETLKKVATSMGEALSRLSYPGIWSRIFGDSKS